MYISTFWPGITTEKFHFDLHFHLEGEKNCGLKNIHVTFPAGLGSVRLHP